MVLPGACLAVLRVGPADQHRITSYRAIPGLLFQPGGCVLCVPVGGFMPPVCNDAAMRPAVQPGGFMPPVHYAAAMRPAAQ